MFATTLAADYFQALAIGGGWTAFISLTQLNKKDKEGKTMTEQESKKIDETGRKLGIVITDQADTIAQSEEAISTLQSSMKTVTKENSDLKEAIAKMANKMREHDIKSL
jgi:predicted RNase H-like nuclease (RuvC/YqgF family)